MEDPGGIKDYVLRQANFCGWIVYKDVGTLRSGKSIQASLLIPHFSEFFRLNSIKS